MFVHFTMGDLDFLNNSSEHVVPFHSYCSHYLSFLVIQIMLHIKLTSLACMNNSGVLFCSTLLYQFSLL